MNPDDFAIGSVIGYCSVVAIPALMLFMGIAFDDEKDRDNPFPFFQSFGRLKKILSLSIIVALIPVVWLVSPWFGLMIYNIHRANTGLVNDQMRQEKVLEPQEKTRPSKQDKEPSND